MDFRLSETQTLIAETVAALADDHVGATRGIDRPGRRAADDRLWSRLAELGLLGAEIEEALGGGGGAFEDVCVILQGLGRAGGSGDVVPAAVMAAGLISSLGDEALKAALLPPLIAGTARPALAVSADAERRSGVTAVSVDGGWRLSGRVETILGGAAASTFIVAAGTGSGEALFVVAADADGVAVEPVELYDGTGAARVRLDAVFAAPETLLGAVGQARAAVDRALDRANAAFVNEAVGLMAQLCDLTLDHIRTREQFGRTLGSFQVVQHRMVDMRIDLEMARSMAVLAAVAADDPDPVRRARDVSAAKAAVGRAARAVGQSAIQLHGAIALTEDYPAGAYVRRLTLIARAFGDADWHLNRFAALSRPGA